MLARFTPRQKTLISALIALVGLLGGPRLLDHMAESHALRLWVLGVESAQLPVSREVMPPSEGSHLIPRPTVEGWSVEVPPAPAPSLAPSASVTVTRDALLAPYQPLLGILKGLLWFMGGLIVLLIWCSPLVWVERLVLRHFGQSGAFFSLATATDDRPELATPTGLLFWHWIGNALLKDRIDKLVHEFGTPLTVIRLSVSKIRSRKATRPRSAYLDEILAQTARMEGLLQRMLNLARLQHQARERTLERFDLEDVLGEVLEAGWVIAEMGEVTVDFHRKGPCPLYGERTLLFAAFRNLLANAVRLTPAGGRVDVAIEREATGCTVVIADQGPGIDPSDEDQVFERFYTASDSEEKGTGLGLALVMDVVLLHGGKIRLVNREEGGAKALFWLPLKPRLPL